MSWEDIVYYYNPQFKIFVPYYKFYVQPEFLQVQAGSDASAIG